MKFFKEVISHLMKTAFEGHTQFSVADSTAVGANPIRSITLDAVPVNNDTLISLAWEGGEKLFEKTLSEQEASHQFELISTDLAEVAELTKRGEYDSAKALMKKLGQKYTENTGDIVQTNLPKLHNTQAAHKHEDLQMSCDRCSKTMCPGCGMTTSDGSTYHTKCKKEHDADAALDPDLSIWKQAKITMQNLWFSNNQELLEYQKLSKKPAEDNGPLWDQNKGTKPAPKTPGLAPASLSYDDMQEQKEKEHEDMQKHIDEKIKTELESALQEKAASVFGPDQVELVKVLRKNGRNWDEIKKILVKDFGFDKDAVNIFVDEQRQGADPTSVEVEPVTEDKKETPLTPPEDLVSPETHEKLLQDHELKKKDKSPITDKPELDFTPKDVMNIPEDEEIVDQSSLSNEIARADNDDVHKAASMKTAADDLNPLQEPIQEEPTTPSQDVVPMGKPKDHHMPQKGDRVFVSSDMSGERAGFEASFISTYKSQGVNFSIVETDEGDLVEIESNRVTKTSEGSGAQDTEPVMEPVIEQQQPDAAVPVAPKMDDFHTSSQKTDLTVEAGSRKCEICGEPTHKGDAELCSACEEGMKTEADLKELKSLLKTAAEQETFWDERSYDEKYPMMAKYPEIVDKVVDAIKQHGDNWYKVDQKMFYDSPFYMMNLSHDVGSREGGQLIKEVNAWLKEHESGADKVFTPRTYEEIQSSLKEASDNKIMVHCEDCNKTFHTAPDSAIDTESKQASDFEKGISQNKTADCTRCDKANCGGLGYGCKCGCHMTPEERNASQKHAAEPTELPKTQFKDYKITPKYTPKEQAQPASPELDQVLFKMDALQQKLAALDAARKQIQAEAKAKIDRLEQEGQRAPMEEELQASIQKAGVLIEAVESKVVQWKDKLFAMQTENIKYVPSLTPKEMLAKIYAKFEGAEKYVSDVLNGMLSQGKDVTEKTLIRWPNKKSSVNKEASILDDLNHFNEELLAALKELSSPL
ncbi:MAG: hypothetical protein ACREBR_04430 [bacterium]